MSMSHLSRTENRAANNITPRGISRLRIFCQSAVTMQPVRRDCFAVAMVFAGMAGAAKPSSRNVTSMKPKSEGGQFAVPDSDKSPGSGSYDIAYCGIHCASCQNDRG